MRRWLNDIVWRLTRAEGMYRDASNAHLRAATELMYAEEVVRLARACTLAEGPEAVDKAVLEMNAAIGRYDHAKRLLRRIWTGQDRLYILAVEPKKRP